MSGAEKRPNRLRRTLFVKPRFQLSLLASLWIVVGIGMVLSVLGAAAYFLFINEQTQTAVMPEWRSLMTRVAIVAFILLGLLVWASLIMTNRIAGPIYRLMRVMDNVARGDIGQDMRLRRNDAFHDVAEQVNAALLSLRAQREETDQRLEKLRGELDELAREIEAGRGLDAPSGDPGTAATIDRIRRVCSELTGRLK